MYDVITIGAATRDAFVKSDAFEIHATEHEQSEGCFPLGAKIEVEDLLLETGGGATNAAVTFARLGHKAATIASVGGDPSGHELTAALKSEGVHISLLQVMKKLRTAFSIILLAGSGERTILVYRGAAGKLSSSAIPWKSLKARWFYVSSVGGDLMLMKKILIHAEKHGIKVAWNPGSKEITQGLPALAPLIRMVDMFTLNKEEAELLAGTSPRDLKATIAKLQGLPRKVLVITDGLAGAYATAKGKTLHSGIIDVPRINVTGAGDSFGSGMVAGLLKKDDIAYALAVGTWNATGVVQQMGAKKGLIRKYPTPAMTKQVAITEWP